MNWPFSWKKGSVTIFFASSSSETRQVEALGGLEAEHALDHRVEDVAGKVERALELGREVALVHLAVALDLGPVLPVELDGRDPLAADARRRPGRPGSASVPEPDQKTNPRMKTPITTNSVHLRWWKLLRIVLSIENPPEKRSRTGDYSRRLDPGAASPPARASEPSDGASAPADRGQVCYKQEG